MKKSSNKSVSNNKVTFGKRKTGKAVKRNRKRSQ